jgi:hypothetical protein
LLYTLLYFFFPSLFKAACLKRWLLWSIAASNVLAINESFLKQCCSLINKLTSINVLAYWCV